MTDRPNILFILTDQQTRTAMGAYGNPHIRTPNLDALAAGGDAVREVLLRCAGLQPFTELPAYRADAA
jgi:hypothetical protein